MNDGEVKEEMTRREQGHLAGFRRFGSLLVKSRVDGFVFNAGAVKDVVNGVSRLSTLMFSCSPQNPIGGPCPTPL
jgi:hypothetical protein